MRRNRVRTLPFEEAAACGYVPGIKVHWGRAWWNRFLVLVGFKPVPVRLDSEDELPPLPVEHHAPRSAVPKEFLEAQKAVDRVLAQSGEEAAAFWERHSGAHRPKYRSNPDHDQDNPMPRV